MAESTVVEALVAEAIVLADAGTPTVLDLQGHGVSGRRTSQGMLLGDFRFVALNRKISLAWGGTVLVMAVGHLVAAALVASGVSAPFTTTSRKVTQ